MFSVWFWCYRIALILRAATLIGSTADNARLVSLSVVCNVSIRELAEVSDLIFTGKIESLIVDEENRHNKFVIIVVKRVIKLNEKSFENVDSGSRVSVKLTTQFFDNFVGYEFVHKLNDCAQKSAFSDVRVRDTRIFCGRFVDKNNAVFEKFVGNRIYAPNKLLAVSLPLNLKNLDQFAAIEGMIIDLWWSVADDLAYTRTDKLCWTVLKAFILRRTFACPRLKVIACWKLESHLPVILL